jgi:predicted Zn-dependent protease
VENFSNLKKFIREAAARLAREKDVAEYEIYCSTAEHRVARLNYTSDIPSRGIEEFKSLNVSGFALRLVMKRDPHETGFASAAGDLSASALLETIARARSALVIDPHFPGLPREPRRLKRENSVAPGDLMKATDAHLSLGAWNVIGGAMATFKKRAPLKLAHPGLILGGDLSLVRDRVAILNSNFEDLRTDETAYFSSSVTALIESLEAKGTATAIGASLQEMEHAAENLGRDAVARALVLRHGERPGGGTYRILFGPQPIAEIVNYIVLGSLTTGSFQAASSAYQGRFNTQVMDPRLSLLDDPRAKFGPVHRRITCEGLAAESTTLIRDGTLVGLLSNYYDRNRLLTDEHRAEKLGPKASLEGLDFPPCNGYRLGEGGARRFDSHAGSTGTNVILRSRGGLDQKELIAKLHEGIYVGRVWYTYPINGQRAGDFTCTISGDSYVIREGQLAAPLAPNCLRVNANIEQVFAHPLAVGKKSEPAIVWGAPEAYFVPALAVDNLALASVNADEPR